MLLDALVLNLIKALVSEFASTGKKLIPAGRRGEVVGLLTRMMGDPGLPVLDYKLDKLVWGLSTKQTENPSSNMQQP
jgi:hypothetical protein